MRLGPDEREIADESHKVSPTRSSRRLLMILGVLFIALPIVVAYQSLRPTFEILQFLPLSYYLKEMLPTLVLANALILAMVTMVVGGLLLVLGRRWGYILTISAVAFNLAVFLEMIAGIAISASDPKRHQMLEDMIMELYAMFGIIPILLLLLQIVAIIYMNTKQLHSEMCIDKVASRVTIAISVFFFLDLNLCLLFTYASA